MGRKKHDVPFIPPEGAIFVGKEKTIIPKNYHQRQYVDNILSHTITFGIGAAGTGKSYLAVACAVQALLAGECERIVLCRPAVEAGEKIGYLPGDMKDKVAPYLRPLYDALYEFQGFDWVDKQIDKGVIELAPLGFMRGRTLSDAFIIFDESQNATWTQMKMILTRLGNGSKMVITADLQQSDLPRGEMSGAQTAITVLNEIPEISFNYFTSHDVVRHPLVSKIVEACEFYEK